MRLGFDIDEVLADFARAWLKFHNSVYGTDVRYEDMHTYRFEEVTGCSPTEAATRVREFWQTDYFRNIPPVKGSVQALDDLSKQHDCFAITSRSRENETATRNWINRSFSDKIQEVYFANNPYDVLDHPDKKTKNTLCRTLEIDAMFEDSARLANSCVGAAGNVFLFDRPWNRRSSLEEGVVRLYSWDEAVEAIGKMEKE